VWQGIQPERPAKKPVVPLLRGFAAVGCGGGGRIKMRMSNGKMIPFEDRSAIAESRDGIISDIDKIRYRAIKTSMPQDMVEKETKQLIESYGIYCYELGLTQKTRKASGKMIDEVDA
jgi:hypothetical protein